MIRFLLAGLVGGNTLKAKNRKVPSNRSPLGMERLEDRSLMAASVTVQTIELQSDDFVSPGAVAKDVTQIRITGLVKNISEIEVAPQHGTDFSDISHAVLSADRLKENKKGKIVRGKNGDPDTVIAEGFKNSEGNFVFYVQGKLAKKDWLTMQVDVGLGAENGKQFGIELPEVHFIRRPLQVRYRGTQNPVHTVFVPPEVPKSADLSVEVLGSTLGRVGQNVSYNVTVVNHGTDVAKNATVTLTVPEGFSDPRFLPQGKDGIDNDGDGLVDFPNDPDLRSDDDVEIRGSRTMLISFGDLLPGQSKWEGIAFRVDSPAERATHVLEAVVGSYANDPVLENNVSTIEVTAVPRDGMAELSVTLQGPPEVLTASIVSYVADIRNAGTDLAKNVTLTVPRMDGLIADVLESQDPSRDWVLNLGDIAPGESVREFLLFRVPTGAPGSEVVRASVGSDTFDTRLTDNVASVDVIVTPAQGSFIIHRSGVPILSREVAAGGLSPDLVLINGQANVEGASVYYFGVDILGNKDVIAQVEFYTRSPSPQLLAVATVDDALSGDDFGFALDGGLTLFPANTSSSIGVRVRLKENAPVGEKFSVIIDRIFAQSEILGIVYPWYDGLGLTSPEQTVI